MKLFEKVCRCGGGKKTVADRVEREEDSGLTQSLEEKGKELM